MSSALKRRFNFETVYPIQDLKLEMKVVKEQTKYLLDKISEKVNFSDEIMELLVTTFHEMRNGFSREGIKFEKPSTIMSTAEAVSVGYSSGLFAYYYGDGVVKTDDIVNSLVGSVVKDNREDIKRLRQYFDFVIKARGQNIEDNNWSRFYQARKYIR